MIQTVDITIVQGALVPVGEDQVSHLELSREIVRRFNRLYGDVLLEPQALLSQWPNIPGSDGRKMSKSLDNTIDLDDEPDTIRAKVRSFITDPQKVRRGDPAGRRSARYTPCTASSLPTSSSGPTSTAGRASWAASTARRTWPTASSTSSRRSGSVARSSPRSRGWSRTCSPPAPTAYGRSWKTTMAAVRNAMHFA